MGIKKGKGIYGENNNPIPYTFNNLEVIKRDNSVKKVTAVCHCGNTFTVSEYRVLTKRTKSCGCLKYRGEFIPYEVNKLKIVSYAGKNKFNKHLVNVECVCGSLFTAIETKIRKGRLVGCRKCGNERISESVTTHGMRKTKIYKVWQGMKKRCFNCKEKSYPGYGGRGITVCGEWLVSFDNFYKDMGPLYYAGAFIDRIDVNGNYEKSNCRWVDVLESNRNTRVITFIGRTPLYSILDAAESFGISKRSIRGRFYVRGEKMGSIYEPIKGKELVWPLFLNKITEINNYFLENPNA